MLLRAKLGVAAACLMGLIDAVVSFIPWKVAMKNSETGERYYEWISSGLVNLDIYLTVYEIVFDILLKFVIPFLIIVPMTGFTIYLLLRQRVRRRSLQQGTQPAKQDYAITVMLVGVVVAFISLHGPYMIVSAIPLNVITQPWFYTLNGIANSLMTVNPICNFIIYFVTGSAFRHSLRRVFVCGHE